MTRRIAVTVEPGEVRVAAIWLARNEPDLVHIMIDFHTKRAEFTCESGSSDSDERSFYVDAKEDGSTMNLDESKRGDSTRINVDGIPAKWQSVMSLSRYTGHIILMPRPELKEDASDVLWGDS